MRTAIIIDKHPVIRKGYTSILSEHFQFESVAEFTNLKELMDTKLFRKSDLMILNITDSHLMNKEMIRKIKSQYCRMLLLIYDEMEHLAFSNILYLRSGANGYLSKQTELDEFLICLKRVLRGDRYVSEKQLDVLLGATLEYANDLQNPLKKMKPLTPRELQIAEYLSQGMRTKNVAERLGLKVSTISTMKAKIFTKLRIDSIVKLHELIH